MRKIVQTSAMLDCQERKLSPSNYISSETEESINQTAIRSQTLQENYSLYAIDAVILQTILFIS